MLIQTLLAKAKQVLMKSAGPQGTGTHGVGLRSLNIHAVCVVPAKETCANAGNVVSGHVSNAGIGVLIVLKTVANIRFAVGVLRQITFSGKRNSMYGFAGNAGR